MKKILLLLVLILFTAVSISAQTALPAPDNTPEEYEDDEFPQWMKDLRRGEIIAIGSFPLTFFATQLIYGFVRYAKNDFDDAYNPGFLIGSSSAEPYTDKEKGEIILISISASLAFALADFIIGKIIEDD